MSKHLGGQIKGKNKADVLGVGQRPVRNESETPCKLQIDGKYILFYKEFFRIPRIKVCAYTVN